MSLFKLVFSVFLDIYLGVEFLGHMVVLFLFFYELPYCFPQWLHQLAFPPTVYKGSLFSTPSPAFVSWQWLYCDTKSLVSYSYSNKLNSFHLLYPLPMWVLFVPFTKRESSSLREVFLGLPW